MNQKHYRPPSTLGEIEKAKQLIDYYDKKFKKKNFGKGKFGQ